LEQALPLNQRGSEAGRRVLNKPARSQVRRLGPNYPLVTFSFTFRLLTRKSDNTLTARLNHAPHHLSKEFSMDFPNESITDDEQKREEPAFSNEPVDPLAILFTPLRANNPIEQFVRRT
jgi:hypothetical protein